MNRLKHYWKRSLRARLIPLILGAGLVTPVWGDQSALPPAAAGQVAAASAKPTEGSAREARIAATQSLLQRAETALASQNYADAVELYRRARVNAQPLPQLQPQVAALRKTLEGTGIQAALLDLPPTAPPSAASMTPEQKKAEVLRLVAQGRAALERGDVALSQNLVAQAEGYAVPESAFTAGEPRVWQLALDVQAAAKRQGSLAQVSGISSGTDSGVRQASGLIADEAGGVVNSVFNASVGDLAAGNIQPVQNLQSAGGGDGDALYHRGMEALAAGDSAGARQLFIEAWRHEATMDVATRAQLKEKLTLLQPARLPEPTPEQMADLSPIERAELEAQAEARRIYREITNELAAANELRTSNPMESLDRLTALRRRVQDSKLEAAAAASMLAMVDRAIGEQKQYVDANRGQIELDLANAAVMSQIVAEQEQTIRIDDQISGLVETFNDLMDQRRYPEAEVVAKQVGELKPGSAIAKSLMHTSRMGTRLMINEEIRATKEDHVAKTLLDLDRSGTPMDPSRDLIFGNPEDWNQMSRRRRAMSDAESHYSAAERAINDQLSTPINVNYKNQPLEAVLRDLGAVTNVPVIMDRTALGQLRVAPDTPVTIELTNPIPLKSALNLILNEVEMTYLIENDVLKITSHEVKNSRLRTKTYRVADLVTAIPNFPANQEQGLAKALRNAYQMTANQPEVQVMPVSFNSMAGGAPGAGPLDPKAMAQFGNPMMGMGMGMMPPNMEGGFRGMSGHLGHDFAMGGSMFNAMELMSLIQSTITPDMWMGNPYSIAQSSQNLSLVVSAPSEVHDQIAELLASLRKLQNLQVTIEVRFITLSDSFFEQIGVDFDLSFDDNVKRLPTDDAGPKVTIGWDGINGMPTSDFDIKLNNTFGVTPPFGGMDASGSTLGFAILSDIEAFFFLQAAQGDSRTNVLQAPKVTMYDGQQAMINDTVQRLFVTSITPMVGDFAVAQQPVVTVISEGTQLNVQAVVSEDKRFVRVTLMPHFSQIGDVDTFTYEGRRVRSSSSVERDPVTGEPITNDDEEEYYEGTTVQQPTVASTQIMTTVSVPDGGTILMGGIKRMREGRSERGVPILSKIPYINRLFRNVAIGRDAQSLMMMVTPRIIIQEEEEIAQTGFDPNL